MCAIGSTTSEKAISKDYIVTNTSFAHLQCSIPNQVMHKLPHTLHAQIMNNTTSCVGISLDSDIEIIYYINADVSAAVSLPSSEQK